MHCRVYINEWVFCYSFFLWSEEEFNHSSLVISGERILSIQVSVMKANWFMACFPLISYCIRAQVTFSLSHCSEPTLYMGILCIHIFTLSDLEDAG